MQRSQEAADVLQKVVIIVDETKVAAQLMHVLRGTRILYGEHFVVRWMDAFHVDDMAQVLARRLSERAFIFLQTYSSIE